MKLGLEHIGKKVQFGDGREIGFFVGRVPDNNFDMENTRVILRDEFNKFTSHGCGNYEMAHGFWHLVEEPKLPATIQPLMKEFGCHEAQTTLLVSAILKHVEENFKPS